MNCEEVEEVYLTQQLFWSSTHAFENRASLAATLAVTPMAPTPPRLLNSKAVSSLPVPDKLFFLAFSC